MASIGIAVVSLAGPLVVATVIALGPLGWSTKASLIAGTALSTTSLAVVYAVLVETGLNTGPPCTGCRSCLGEGFAEERNRIWR